MSTTNHRYSVSSFASNNSASQRQLDHIIPRSSSVSEMVDIDDKFIRKPKNKPAYVAKRNSRSFNDAYQSSSNQYNSSGQQQKPQNYYPNQQYMQQQYQQQQQYKQQYPQQQYSQQQYPQQQYAQQQYAQQQYAHQQYPQQQYPQQQYPQQQYAQQQYPRQYQQQRNAQYEQKQYQKQQPYSTQLSNQYILQNQRRKIDPRQHQYSKSQSFPQQYPQKYPQQVQKQMRQQMPVPPSNNFYNNSQPSPNLNIQKQQVLSPSQNQTQPVASNSSLNIPQRSINRPNNQPFGKSINNSPNRSPNRTNNTNNISNANNINSMNTNINPDYLRNPTPGKSSPSTTATSDSSTSINRTPIKQLNANSNSKTNIASPLTDISSNEDSDTPNFIQMKNQFQKIPIDSQQQQLPSPPVNYETHPILPQKQHKANPQNSEYNDAALAARTAVKNTSIPVTGKQHFPTPISSNQQSTPNLKSIPPPTPVPTNSISTAQIAKKDSFNSEEKKSGFFRKIFSRSKSSKPNKSITKSNSSSTLSSSTSTDPKKDSKFSLRRISLIRTISRTSSKSQSTSRSSSIDIVRMGEPRGITKQQNLSKSSLNNSVSNNLPEMNNADLNNTNNTMRVFTPVTEAGENNSSFNTISNSDLPLSNRTISPFNSAEPANYNYMIDLNKPIETSYNSDSTKHSLIGTKSDNNSFYSANEFALTNNNIDDEHNNGSNRIIREKNSYNHLRKTSTQTTQITQATHATQATQNTQYSERSDANDFDHSLISISKIDSKIIKKAGHDHEVVELGYLSTIAGLGETNFFNTHLTTVNTNRSNKSEITNSTSKNEINENGVIKLSVPGNSDNKSIKKKSSTNSLKVREEKKGLITKLGRKIPFIKLRERFDFSFDDSDDTFSKHDGYKNKKILEDEDEDGHNTDEENDSVLNYDSSFFQDLKTKHILPFDYVPKHHEIEAKGSCMKDEDNIENLMHSKNVQVGFVDDVKEGITFGNDSYDRSNPDMKKVYVMMTYYPREIRAIRMELNDFKKNEMIVNEESKQFTHIFEV